MLGLQPVTMIVSGAAHVTALRTNRRTPMKTIEYEFVLRDGSTRYEIVDPDAGYSVLAQVNMFMKLHGAYIARLLKPNDPTYPA
jgi:hypothetical protein